VGEGHTLALANCPAVGIDPLFTVTAELSNHVTLLRTISDEYFARPDPLAPTGGQPFDLSLIDGLHLFEHAFRDFINAERHSSRRGVVILNNVLPRSVDEAARERHTVSWTGDIYSMVPALARYRPELVVLPVATQPTVLLVLGLDPDNTVLSDHYDEIMAEYRHADPQPVPEELFDRQGMLPAERVLSSNLWDVIAGVDVESDPVGFHSQLVEAVRSSLGAALVPSPQGQGPAIRR
jgi:hypothetical protein